MSKKITQILLMVTLVLSLAACGTGPKSTIVPSPVETQVVANTPEAGDLVISNTNAFVDKYGSYRVVGMLVNKTNNVLTGIKLTLEIIDASGNSLLKENGNPVPGVIFHPMLKTLAPGEGSPFEYSYDTANGVPASYKVTITALQSGDTKRANLTAENVQIVDNGSGWYYLTGELVNKGTQWARINYLAGAILDTSNNVLSADQTITYTTELAPAGDTSGGDRTPFEINFPNPGGSATPNWNLYWDTDVIDNANLYPVTTNITNGYVDQYGAQHIVGWVTNHSNQALTSLVVAGLYDQVGIALDASYSNLAIPLKAGEAIPFSILTFGNVDNDPAQAAQVRTFTAQVDPGNTALLNYEFVELAANGETIQKDGATWTISGSVTNTSNQQLSSATVVVAVMDAQNNLVAMESTALFPSGHAIDAGEADPYSISINLDPSIDASGFITTTTVIGEISK